MPVTNTRRPPRARESRRALVFRIGVDRYALPVENIEIVLWSAALTPLPNAPRVVLGLFNFHGRLFPVLDAPARLGRGPTPPLRASDLFVLTRRAERPVALRVDCVDGVVGYDEAELERSADTVADVRWMSGVLRQPDGLLLVHDIEAFLTDEEASQLDAACQDAGAE